MTTYVLIPGACHGAWCFDDLAAALARRRPPGAGYTLTGVAERAHLAHGGRQPRNAHHRRAGRDWRPSPTPRIWCWSDTATAAW